MQQYVTKQMLAELELDIDDDRLEKLNETIEEHIGVEIAESVDDEQLKELLDLEENASEDEIGKWITEHVPNYMEIVQDNIDIAIGELVEETDPVGEASAN